MKTIPLSKKTANAFENVTEIYRAGQMFDSPGVVKETEDLRKRMTAAIRAFKVDWNRYLNLKDEKVSISWEIRYNALYLLSRRSGCTIIYAIYDTSTETCYDAGSSYDRNCA